MTHSTASVREAATRYIANGFAVIPIPHGQKGPVIRGWQSLRIKSADEFPTGKSNIGTILGQASGGLICVDLDHPVAVELASQFLPATGLIAGRSQGGKVHWFYRVQGEFKKIEFTHKSTKLKVIEMLGDGQQVVVGPSIHPTGDTYDDLEGDPSDIEADQLVDACRLLFHAVCDRLGLDPFEGVTVQQQPTQRCTQSSDGERPGDDFNEHGDVRELLLKHGWKPSHEAGDREYWVRPGKTHGIGATLSSGKVFYVFSSSTSLEVGRGYSPFSLYAALEHSGDYSAASAELRRQGFGKSSDAVPNVDISALMVGGESVAQPDTVPPIPPNLLNPGGLLQQIIDFNLRTAHKQQPELALAGAIALMATIAGRRVEDDYGTRPNIYLVGVGASGCGKDHARKINKLLLAAVGKTGML